MVRFIATTFCLVGAPAAIAEEKRFAYEMPLMGTMWRVVMYAPDEEKSKAAADGVFKRVEILNEVMSDYKADSEVRRLGLNEQEVSTDLLKVMTRSLVLAEASEGAFDVTAGTLTRLWRRAFRRGELPSDSSIEAALDVTGWKQIRIDRRTSRIGLGKMGVRIDLGGIGKGFALDEAMAVLKKEYGITRALIDAGGDLIAGDSPPEKDAWTVTVRGNGEEFFLEIVNEAVATSGDLHQSKLIGGVRYSHIIDPRTGIALKNGAAATVVARQGWLADGLASAACVQKHREAKRLIEKQKAAARVTRRLLSGEIKTHDIGGFRPATPK